MNNLKVVNVSSECIEFDKGLKLYSNHDSACCESHELWFDDLTIEDFKDLSFDLSKDDFFKRIPNYGIELIPIKGWSVKIPGYGRNNGYYSDQLDLILTDGKDFNKSYDITDCQVVDGY